MVTRNCVLTAAFAAGRRTATEGAVGDDPTAFSLATRCSTSVSYAPLVERPNLSPGLGRFWLTKSMGSALVLFPRRGAPCAAPRGVWERAGTRTRRHGLMRPSLSLTSAVPSHGIEPCCSEAPGLQPGSLTRGKNGESPTSGRDVAASAETPLQGAGLPRQWGAGRDGFEPPSPDSESGILPLDDPPENQPLLARLDTTVARPDCWA